MSLEERPSLKAKARYGAIPRSTSNKEAGGNAWSAGSSGVPPPPPLLPPPMPPMHVSLSQLPPIPRVSHASLSQAPPPPPPPAGPPANAIDENGLYRVDDKYPAELKALCKAAKCELCDVKLTCSGVVSSHYVGKAHERKARTWLLSRSGRHSGEETPLYCKYCDKNFSSQIVAHQHFIGKKHQQVMRIGLPNSSTNIHTGYVERSETAKEDKTGRCGIGLGFASGSRGLGGAHQFVCVPCSVSCPTQATLDAHLGGSKHRKKCPDAVVLAPTGGEVGVDLALNSSQPSSQPTKGCSDALNASQPSKNGLSEVDRQDFLDRVLRVDLRCSLCSRLFDDIILLVDHLRSKEHVKTIFGNRQLGRELGRKFECEKCWQTINGADAMVSHIKFCDGSSKFST